MLQRIESIHHTKNVHYQRPGFLLVINHLTQLKNPQKAFVHVVFFNKQINLNKKKHTVSIKN